jgi:hypothetical protein
VGNLAGIALNLDVGLHGKLVIIYGDADLTFEEPPTDLWEEFTGFHEGKLGIRIDKSTGEVHVIYMFDEYEEGDYVGARKYQLETYGTWSLGSIPYGTVEVDNKDFTIDQIVYQRTSKKKGKGAIGVTYKEVLTGGGLSFTITIEELAS